MAIELNGFGWRWDEIPGLSVRDDWSLTPEEEAHSLKVDTMSALAELGFCGMCGGPLEIIEDTDAAFRSKCRTCGGTLTLFPLRHT